jgi:hypothetical protein
MTTNRILAALAAVCITGCSALERGTEKVVAKGLEAVNQDENRSRVEELLTSEEIREATRELTGVVLETAVADLTDQERRDRIREIAVEFVDDLTPALVQAFDDDVWPGVRDKLREALTLTLDQVLSEETLDRAGAFAADTAREVIEQTAPELVESVAAGLSKGIETAFAAVLQEQVIPALESAFARDYGPAAQELARHTAHGALLGVADAMNGDFGVVFDRERDEIFDRLDASTERVAWRFKAALAALGLLLVAGLVVLVLLRRGQRQREQAIDLLLGELRRRDGDPLESVRESGRSSAGGVYLEKHLSRRGR